MFNGWNELFTGLLEALDDKWEGILKQLMNMKETMSDQKLMEMLKELKLEKHVAKINRTMYMSLLQYTQGDAHAKVVSNGLKLSLDSYRYLYHKGKTKQLRIS